MTVLPSTRRGLLLLIAASSLALLTAAAHAQPAVSVPGLDSEPRLAMLPGEEQRPRRPRPQPKQERPAASWSVALDNDILVPGSRDQDYTYGLSFSYTGARAADAWFSLDRPLGWLDRLVGVDDRSPEGIDGHSIEFGMQAFTPEEVKIKDLLPGDRPYASLVYLSSHREQIDRARDLAWHTSFTLGALGLPLVGEAQNTVHRITGSNRARGWDHQISDGGEPTARYTVARQKYLTPGRPNLEVKSTLQGSVGYLTEARWSLSFRAGRLRSPWWRFNPELARYGEGASYANPPGGVQEHYVWGGIGTAARAYNAFLQGQFRDSDLSYDHDEVRHLVGEAWLGYTLAWHNGWRLSYVLRAQSSELKDGPGDRHLLWGGMVIAHTF